LLKVVLLEDEEYNREFIKKLLYDIPVVTEVFATSSAEQAVALARKHNPELILLDIELDNDDLNGLEVARKIYNFNQEAYLVFVTAYSKYAIDSFEVHPYSYILKPIKIEKFREIIIDIADKVRQKNVENDDTLVIKSKEETIHIRKREIIFIEIQNSISFIHTKEAIYETHQSLRELEEILNERFLRVHKSFIVSLDRIKRIYLVRDRSYEIEFYGYPQKALMSRYRYQEYKKQFNI